MQYLLLSAGLGKKGQATALQGTGLSCEGEDSRGGHNDGTVGHCAPLVLLAF